MWYNIALIAIVIVAVCLLYSLFTAQKEDNEL